MSVAAVLVVFGSFQGWYGYKPDVTVLCERGGGCYPGETAGVDSEVSVPFGDGYLTASAGLLIWAAAWSAYLFPGFRRVLLAISTVAGMAVVGVAANGILNPQSYDWFRELEGHPTEAVWVMAAAGAAIAVPGAIAIGRNDLRALPGDAIQAYRRWDRVDRDEPTGERDGRKKY